MTTLKETLESNIATMAFSAADRLDDTSYETSVLKLSTRGHDNDLFGPGVLFTDPVTQDPHGLKFEIVFTESRRVVEMTWYGPKLHKQGQKAFELSDRTPTEIGESAVEYLLGEIE